MTALYPCPKCMIMTPVRVAPSGSTRLVRHYIRGQANFGLSCAGTGYAIVERFGGAPA